MSDYVCVIGGINVDIKGISAGHAEDSHPGKIIITPGGVARNMSENLASLGMEVHLFGCVGKDVYGRMILESSVKAGVNTDKVLIAPDKKTGLYLSVSDESGNLIHALNDMLETSAMIDRIYIDRNLEFISGSRMIVLDTNIEIEVLMLITEEAEKKNIPVFIDAVSPSKVKKLKQIESAVDYLSLNSSEYRSLFGQGYEISKQRQPELSNIKNVLLRNGAEGAVLLSGKEKTVTDAAIPEIVEPNGAGDAFNSGFIYGILKGSDKSDSMIYGKCASKFILESECSAGGNLNSSNLEKLFYETKRKQK